MASTIDSNHKYAYGANVGWIDVGGSNDGGVIGQFFCSGFIYGANIGWIHLGDGTPDNGVAYSNSSGSDYGVNHDGLGHLSGYAYGENIGWVTFEQSYGEPQVDMTSGILSGYVWSGNIGWISLSNSTAHVRTQTLDAGADTDFDEIPDAWEYSYSKGLNDLSYGVDSDGDGLFDEEEYLADTNPFDSNDLLHISDFLVSGNTNIVVWPCLPTRAYRLEYNTDLVHSNWNAVSESFIPPSESEVEETVYGVTDSNRFYRVVAFPPLTP